MVTKKTAEASKATSKQDAAGRRVAKKGEPQFANYAEKAVPPRIQELADWLTEQTGYEVDVRSVYLGSSLRSAFQKSDENQARMAQRAEEIVAEREERERARAERAEAKAAREAEKAERAAVAKAAPKAAVKKAPAKKSTAKSTSKTTAQRKAGVSASKAAPATSRRRPARAAKAEEDF